MSSCGGRLGKVLPVAPGGCLVVGGACSEAAVKDADEAIREPSEGVVVLVSLGALLVVGGPGTGEAVRALWACAWRASVSRSLRTNRAATTFFLPEARVTGLVPA